MIDKICKVKIIKKIRGIISTVLVFVMLCGTFAVNAEETASASLKSGDFSYVLSESQTVVITGFNSSATSVYIPDEIAEHPVTEISCTAFENRITIKRISIPKSVEKICTDIFSMLEALTEINVNDANKCYKSVDGILYDKNMETLIKYPPKIQLTNTHFQIP